jgi:dihydropteroate synthase
LGAARLREAAFSPIISNMMETMDLPNGRTLDFSRAPLVMAIVNCTEDSFYAGSRNASAEAAVECALAAERAGAAIVDFGAESTRPGAAYVAVDEELSRLLPVVEGFRKRSRLPVSIDTRKFAVARRALEAGADIINDVSALEDSPEIGALCAERGASLVLMHKKGVPQDMQDKPYYDDVVAEVVAYLAAAAERAQTAGIPARRIILDPGIGFGKRLQDNLDLLAHFDKLVALGYPTLMALSRKAFIGKITGRDTDARLAGTMAANAYALFKGAHIIRAHDVGEAVDLANVFYAIRGRP